MSAAVAAILEGMPEPRDLRMHEHDGRCVITAGRVVLFEYAAGDVVMRNIALAALRQLGFKGRVVAAVLGLTENYVATLHNAALRDGSAALVMQDRRGTPGKVTGSSGSWPGRGGRRAPVTRRSGGGCRWRTLRSAAPWDRASKRRPGNASPAGRRRNPCSPATGRNLILAPNLILSRNPGPVLVLACLLPGGCGVAAARGGRVQVAVCGGDVAACLRGGRAGAGRSWRLRRAGRRGGPGMRRCWRR